MKSKRNNDATLCKDIKIHQEHNLIMFFSSATADKNDSRHINLQKSNSRSSILGSPTSSTTMSSSSGEDSSPTYLSPENQASPYVKSLWTSSHKHPEPEFLLREDGHVYALATHGDLLYTGSDSKNIRVWKNLEEFSGFKSNSEFVKAIVVLGDKIFTGHQDGKIRVWKFCGYDKKKAYKRSGNLPTTKDYLASSVNPESYVRVRRNRNMPWIKHFDAVSSIAVDQDKGLLYSGSWDKTVKVWRISDSKCLESIKAHDDAVNAVAIGFDGVLFTGAADGTLKMWRRHLTAGNHSKHVLVNTLLKQETAVTSLVVNMDAMVMYAGSSDGLVNFWKRENDDVISPAGVLRGHKMAVLCLAAVGTLVLSGSADKSICVWRREEGGIHTCLSVLTGHDGPVRCLASEEEFHDGDDDSEHAGRSWVVYSGSVDNTVRVWRVGENQQQKEQDWTLKSTDFRF